MSAKTSVTSARPVSAAGDERPESAVTAARGRSVAGLTGRGGRAGVPSGPLEQPSLRRLSSTGHVAPGGKHTAHPASCGSSASKATAGSADALQRQEEDPGRGGHVHSEEKGRRQGNWESGGGILQIPPVVVRDGLEVSQNSTATAPSPPPQERPTQKQHLLQIKSGLIAVSRLPLDQAFRQGKECSVWRC